MEFYAKKMENGNLVIAYDLEFYDNEVSVPILDILKEGLKHYSENGSFTPFDPKNASRITNSICIAEKMVMGEDGPEIHGDFWYYPNDNFLKELHENGAVVFVLAT